MSEENISDELLTAYLDDEVEAADRVRIDAALAEDEELQGRLALLDVPLDPIRDAMAQVAAQAPAPVLPPASAQRRFPLAVAGGSLAAGLVLGALLMTQLTPAPKAPGWIDYVASYQALYSTETLAGVELTPEIRAAQLASVSTAVGRPLEAAASVPGLDFKRAQTLGFNGKPLVQMAYLSADGVPLAFCIISKEQTAELKQLQREGLQAASWSDGSHAYLLIGGDDPQLIETTARQLQSLL